MDRLPCCDGFQWLGNSIMLNFNPRFQRAQAPDDLDAAMREADLLDAEGGIGLEQFRALLAGEIGVRALRARPL